MPVVKWVTALSIGLFLVLFSNNMKYFHKLWLKAKILLLMYLMIQSVFVTYQFLHLKCCDTMLKNHPHEWQVQNYIVRSSDNQFWSLRSYIFLSACRSFYFKNMAMKKSPYMMLILLSCMDIEKNPGPETWTAIRNPNFCNFLRVAIYKVFLGDKLIPTKENDAECESVIEVDIGLRELKELLGEHYKAESIDTKNLKKNISRFMDSMKIWGEKASSEKDHYCDVFSPLNWKNLNRNQKKEHQIFVMSAQNYRPMECFLLPQINFRRIEKKILGICLKRLKRSSRSLQKKALKESTNDW